MRISPAVVDRTFRAAAYRAIVALGTVLLLAGAAACTPPNLPLPQAPMSSSAEPSTAPPPRSVLIGVGLDGPVEGFNPHAIADASPITTAVAALVLPSTFIVAANGSIEMNQSLLIAASVVSTDPFTVRYTLNKAASWSDGTPITGADFRYLQQQMVSNPGTVDPAGYALVSQIRTVQAGKVVDVQFSAPFPDWRTLFANLLPAHLVKDAPGGWTDGLAAGLPVSGGRYKMASFDTVTGEITLQRNDKFWSSQQGPATVVLRLGTVSDLAAAFGRGDLQALLVRPGSSDQAALTRAVPAERRVTVPSPATVDLIFNTASGPTADPRIRRAVAAGIRVAAVRAELGDGSSESMLAVDSQVRLPAQDAVSPGPATALPPTGDPTAAGAELAAGGYSTAGLYAVRGGQVLRLTLGYAAGDARLQQAARSIQHDLGTVGILVDLQGFSLRSLVGGAASGKLDLTLLTVPRGRSDAAAAASAFGCADTTDTADTAAVRTGNLSGYCAARTQSLLAAATAGDGSVIAADTAIWSALPVLPLGEPVWVFAVSAQLSSVLAGSHQGWLWTGPLAGLIGWPAA